MLGVPKVRLLARSWIWLVHPDSHETVRRVVDLLQSGTLPEPICMQWLKNDNASVWLEISFMRRRDTKRLHVDLVIVNVRQLQKAA